MSNSLRCKIKHLCHNGTFTERERDRILKALEQEPYEDAEIQKMQEIEQAEIQKAYELGKASQFKVGHWIKKKPYPMLEYDYECSECGHDVIDKTPYCSECGSKMEREVKK